MRRWVGKPTRNPPVRLHLGRTSATGISLGVYPFSGSVCSGEDGPFWVLPHPRRRGVPPRETTGSVAGYC